MGPFVGDLSRNIGVTRGCSEDVVSVDWRYYGTDDCTSGLKQAEWMHCCACLWHAELSDTRAQGALSRVEDAFVVELTKAATIAGRRESSGARGTRTRRAGPALSHPCVGHPHLLRRQIPALPSSCMKNGCRKIFPSPSPISASTVRPTGARLTEESQMGRTPALSSSRNFLSHSRRLLPLGGGGTGADMRRAEIPGGRRAPSQLPSGYAEAEATYHHCEMLKTSPPHAPIGREASSGTHVPTLPA